MKQKAIFAICAAILFAGCAHTPTWTKANAQQRADGDFLEDDAYLASPQCAADIEEDVDTVIRLRKQLGRTQ